MIFVSSFTYRLIIRFYKNIKHCQREKLIHVSGKMGLIRWFVAWLFAHFPECWRWSTAYRLAGVGGSVVTTEVENLQEKKIISQATCGCPCQVTCLLGKLHNCYLLLVKENYHLAQQMALSRTIHNLSYCREAEKQRVTRHNVIIQEPRVDFLIELLFPQHSNLNKTCVDIQGLPPLNIGSILII